MTTYIPIAQISKKKKPKKKSTGTVEAFEALHLKIRCKLDGLGKYETEVKFHPTRKWRLDYAWPQYKVALEVHGGIYVGGRHTRGAGFSKDREKMNEAQLLGWIIIEVTTDNLNLLRDWIVRAIELNSNAH